MRITGFDVDGFGLLADQEVTGIGPGTTVVLGPNEAGKSTLHAFLVRTLFGHPRSNDAEGRNRHEPLRGGRHGGVVVAEDDQGRWEVHRYTEGSPRLRVVAPDGTESTGSDAVLPLLGRTVDEARYEQVFAIDLDDLAGVGSLGRGALDDLLFDAATVGTGRSLRSARDEAVERRDALWTPTATKRPLAEAIARRSEARRALAAAQDAAADNLDLRRRLDAATDRVERLSDRQEQQASRIALFERVRDAWPSWARASELADELDGMLDVTIDADAAARARQADGDLAAATGRIEQLREERAAVTQQVNAIELDRDAIAEAEDVEAVAEGLAAHELAVEQLLSAVDALESAEQAAAAALADLGAGWDEERVRSVAVDAPARQRLEERGDELLEDERAAAAARERAEEAARVAARRTAAVEDAAGDLPEVPTEPEVAALEQALGVLRAGLPALDRPVAGERSGDAPAPSSPWPAWAMLVVAAALAVAIAAGAVPAAVPDLVAVAVVAALAAAGAYRLGQGTSPVSLGPVTRIHGTADDVATEVAQAARRFGLGARPSLGDVERVAVRVQAARRQRRARTDAERHLAVLRAEADDARAIADRQEEVARARAVDRTGAESAWVAACREVGLPTDDAVRVTLVLHDRVAAARRALDEQDTARERVDRTRPRVDRFRADAAHVAKRLGHDVTGGEAVRLLPGLRDRVRAAVAASTERDRHQARADELDQALEAAAQVASEARSARDAALAATGAETLDELERRARLAAQRADLEADLAAAERAITQLLGSGPRGDEGRRLLGTADPTAWEQELAAAREAATSLTEERDRALAERTELEAELRRLGGDDAVPRAAQELAAAEHAVAQLAERWAVADTAAHLLEETVARFEREQQPRVLTRASDLLGRATGGQWAQVRRLDGEVVVARSEGGDPVHAEVLSRGTREQLWLCLRLALAEDLSQDRPLPLLVDDLLGTSDPERSLHVARVLAEVARRQQVWLFTCHPRTADLVTSVDPAAGVLRLRRGGTVAGLRRRDPGASAPSDPSPRLDV